MRGGQQVTIEYGFAETPFGGALVGVTARGICYWHFSGGQQADDLAQLQRSWPSSECIENVALAQSIADQAFAPGGAPKPLHLLLRGSNFQLRVWQALLAIKPGQLATYAQIAALVDSPLAARAVGSAVARNSIAWLIPCHRIIRATGDVGEYRWGGERKLALLGWERAMQDGDFESSGE